LGPLLHLHVLGVKDKERRSIDHIGATNSFEFLHDLLMGGGQSGEFALEVDDERTVLPVKAAEELEEAQKARLVAERGAGKGERMGKEKNDQEFDRFIVD